MYFVSIEKQVIWDFGSDAKIVNVNYDIIFI